MDRGAWQATATGSQKSQTRLSDWTTATTHSDRLFLRRGLRPSRTYAVPGKVISSHVNGYKRTLETFSPTCTQRDSADTQKGVLYRLGSAAQHHRSFSRILCLQVSIPDKICNPNIETSQHFHGRAWMCAVWSGKPFWVTSPAYSQLRANKATSPLPSYFGYKQTPFPQVI